ncbi:hypothetical protein [Streptomyces sp. NPDC018693]|uniref:hypothetical protein n=1 Tax=unclassified Streptomyces TaxID=2593676 RepID=UPI0037A93CAE
MIKPGEIPQFTGDLAQLELDHAALKKDAGNIRTTGSDVHSKFQGLSAFYRAPEAEQLFATTKPVQEKADAFASNLETVSSALSSYATEIRPLVSKLAELKTKAQTFVTSVKDDDEWEYDGDKVEEHNQIRDEITATVAAFWAAERTCHNKITAIWGGTQMVAGDGSERTDQYGFSAEDMQNAQLPWGDPVEEKHHWYEVGHWVKSFVWDGLIVDGIWGTIKGLGTLVGFGGWEAMGQAWKGLAQLATGLAITAIPIAGAAFWALPDDKLPSWIRDSRTAMKETGKALVAWDEWGKNPGRAAGAVTFNVLTTVFTGGAGAGVAGAGKAGAVARVLGTAGKVIDPMTYVAKGAGAGLSKIGDISAALKGVGNIDIPAIPENAVRLPEGSAVLPDGTVRLPDGAEVPAGVTQLPDGGFRVPDDVPVVHENALPVKAEGGDPTLYAAPDGNLVDAHGNVLLDVNKQGPPDIANGTSGPEVTGPAGADVPRVDSPVREPAMACAATHTADNAGQHISLGSSLDNTLGDIGRAPDNAAVHAGGDIPTVHAGGDLPTGRADTANLPTNSVDTHVPTGAADNTAPGTATGEHLPGSHADDVTNPGRDLPGNGDTTLPSHGVEPPADTGGLDNLGGPGDEAIPGHADDSGSIPAEGATDDATGGRPDSGDTNGGDGNPYAGHEPDFSRPALLPANGPLTLRDVRYTDDVRTRWERGEEFHRQMMGGGPERHYPVPTNSDPQYPVTATGGRKVDVPVDMPDGRTVAVEVKTYGPYRTITLDDGTRQAVKNEVPLSKHIKEQIHKDIALRRMNPGYDPRWSFTHAGPSAELRAYLMKAKIIFVEYGPTPKKDQWDAPRKGK